MADAGKHAIQTHDGDASTKTFLVGFPFLDLDHIVVTIAAVVQTRGVDYEISNDLLNVVFYTAPAAGTGNVVFTRVGERSTLLVNFTNLAPLTKSELDKAFNQCLYYLQELEDAG